MLWYVYHAARACAALADVIVATDSEEIVALCVANRWSVSMTSPEHRSGTDRVHEVAQTIVADVYVNVQGDEPLARREHLDVLLNLMARKDVKVGTLKTPCSAEDISNPNAVKVVTALDGRALYFSRAPVPFDRDRPGTSGTSSTSASTPTAKRRWTLFAAGRSRSWNAASAWNSCASSTTAYLSTSPKPDSTPWAWIRKRT